MKHLAKYSLLFSSLLAVFNASAATETSGGTITFTGQVTDTTCTINGGNPADLTIALDPIAVSDATTPGIIQKNRKQFTLEFSGCASASLGKDNATGNKNTLNLILSSDNISNDGLYLNNTRLNDNGTKKNVGIALSTLANSQTPINLHTKLDTKAEGDNAVVDLYANYYKVGSNAADTGVINTMLTYTVAYL
ncbi:type 1 fimbrial protein [Salmonella enterica]|uniref:fimbrial protein n=1 Tax=Salmonella enterica TaxID=28901 RepID=UPI00071C72AE|nr:fimbrial protein [Salmonella enterica]EBM9478525.1 type 1 fimbrial protein [Salmonella enterica subsp. enterica serovar Rubislaw]ECT6468340.1 type 1 fimbrial protein [Salmonella enterica subsp. enterica serovar Senegal]EHC8528269.1 type 1 fimbrial protein [Salmonella enterica subsp. enterica serovar 11:r:-]EAQ5803194.1 type 1 fimbrial protein [Salmonella enterica]EBO3245438.1 type 1 fimbrial protein [Salmonella enterica subsp. enterica serovar Rubislaw]